MNTEDSKGISMAEPEYIKERLDKEINWYDKKSCRNQIWYKSLKTVEIVLSSLIPLASGFVLDYPLGKLFVGLLGVAITIIASIISVFKFQENWITYRTTCEALIHEKFFFNTQSGPYSRSENPEPLEILVERVESLISRENSLWQERNKKRLRERKTD